MNELTVGIFGVKVTRLNIVGLVAVMLCVTTGAVAVQAATAGEPVKNNEVKKTMAVTLPELPFAKDALAPYISAETLEFHWGKHHNAYVTNLNNLVAGKPEENQTLQEIILSAEGPLFNNAAQVWNHTFYWHCMKKDGGGEPTGKLAEAIVRDFGSYEAFVKEFTAAATTQFGSGWAWLVLEDGKLKVTKTGNADLPMKHGQKAILTIDVWEHAYYIDYRNARPKYIETFLQKLVNWDFAAKNFAE
jgi:superoxide dismutase, Fe-Mn family